jgi:hypothetical protein
MRPMGYSVPRYKVRTVNHADHGNRQHPKHKKTVNARVKAYQCREHAVATEIMKQSAINIAALKANGWIEL